MTRRLTYAEKGKGIATSSSSTTLRRIRAPEIDTSQAIRDNELTLIGRVTNPQEQSIRDLIPFLIQRWNLRGTATGSELGRHCFQFRFELKEDMDRVLAKRPYHYARWMLILQRWEPIISPDFPAEIPFWIRLRGLPLHYWDPEMFERIGRELGRYDSFELTPTSARILVTINGLHPLIMETIVEFSTGEDTLVTLEFEKLANHCDHCKRLTHTSTECSHRNQSSGEQSIAPQRNRPVEPSTFRRIYDADRQRGTANSWIATRRDIDYHRDERARSHQRAYDQRLDRYGRPFGVRPSSKYDRPEQTRNRRASPPLRKNGNNIYQRRSESPVDSHAYRRDRPPTTIPRKSLTNSQLHGQEPPPYPRVEPRRRSLSFGTRPDNAHLAWKEKPQENYTEHISTPHTTPGRMICTAARESHQQLHEEIMTDLHEVTRQYVNVADPVEREARRQRVLEGESNNMMAERVAAMLAQALKDKGQEQEARQEAATNQALPEADSHLEQNELLLGPQPKKRGRPPGKANTAGKNILQGASSRKRNMQAIQNSPRVRKGNKPKQNSRLIRTQSSKNKGRQDSRAPALPPTPSQMQQINSQELPPPPTGPTAPMARINAAEQNKNATEQGSRTEAADFQNPLQSLP